MAPRVCNETWDGNTDGSLGKLRATCVDMMVSPSPLGNLTNQAEDDLEVLDAEPEKSH